MDRRSAASSAYDHLSCHSQKVASGASNTFDAWYATASTLRPTVYADRIFSSSGSSYWLYLRSWSVLANFIFFVLNIHFYSAVDIKRGGIFLGRVASGVHSSDSLSDTSAGILTSILCDEKKCLAINYDNFYSSIFTNIFYIARPPQR